MSNRRNGKKDGEKKFPKRNDFRWYTKNPTLLSVASNIPFSQTAGLPFNIDNYTTQTIDGVMSIYLEPVFACGEGNTSLLNDIAKDQYAFVRHANSGHANYEANDLMITELAISQAYSFYSWMCRIYGILDYYTAANRYYPDALFKALNVDGSDLQKNQANFYSYIQIFAAKLQQFYMPRLTMYEKLAYIYANIYTDGATKKSQLYIPTTRSWFLYDPRSSSTGGKLTSTMLFSTSTEIDLDAIQTAGERILRPLIIDEDVGIISGDILKAYGASGCIGVTPIKPDYKVEARLESIFLTSLENAMIVANNGHTITNTLEQVISGDDSYLKGTMSWLVGKSNTDAKDKGMLAYWNANRPLNMHIDTPVSEDVVENTRFMHTYNQEDASTTQYRYSLALNDLFAINSVTYITYTYSGTGSSRSRSISTYVMNSPIITSEEDVYKWYRHAMCFSVNPRMAYVTLDEDDEVTNFVYLMDWDNYALLHKEQIDNLNRTCLMSEFNFPNRKSD